MQSIRESGLISAVGVIADTFVSSRDPKSRFEEARIHTEREQPGIPERRESPLLRGSPGLLRGSNKGF